MPREGRGVGRGHLCLSCTWRALADALKTVELDVGTTHLSSPHLTLLPPILAQPLPTDGFSDQALTHLRACRVSTSPLSSRPLSLPPFPLLPCTCADGFLDRALTHLRACPVPTYISNKQQPCASPHPFPPSPPQVASQTVPSPTYAPAACPPLPLSHTPFPLLPPPHPTSPPQMALQTVPSPTCAPAQYPPHPAARVPSFLSLPSHCGWFLIPSCTPAECPRLNPLPTSTIPHPQNTDGFSDRALTHLRACRVSTSSLTTHPTSTIPHPQTQTISRTALSPTYAPVECPPPP